MENKEVQKMPFGWALFCIAFLLISMICSLLWLDIPVHINLLISIAVTLLVSWLNNGHNWSLLSEAIDYGGKICIQPTIIMMLIYLVMAILGAVGVGGGELMEHQQGLLPEGGWGDVFGAVGTGIWFFIGFEFACPMAEENVKPYKYIPWGLILGLISIYVVDIIFIRGVVAYGVLPRKTFSMGSANEKRFYLEGRRIL